MVLQIEKDEEELNRGLPRLAEAEELAAELSESIIEMETAHTAELAMLRSLHLVEKARLAEVTNAKIAICEDLAKCRADTQQAQWEADMFAREQEESIRELCIRQRDNARLAKRHGEARKEALELAVRWEAAGSPVAHTGNEAELRLTHQRCSLLE